MAVLWDGEKQNPPLQLLEEWLYIPPQEGPKEEIKSWY